MPNLSRFRERRLQDCITESAKGESALRVLTTNFRISQDSAERRRMRKLEETGSQIGHPSPFIESQLYDRCLNYPKDKREYISLTVNPLFQFCVYYKIFNY